MIENHIRTNNKINGKENNDKPVQIERKKTVNTIKAKKFVEQSTGPLFPSISNLDTRSIFSPSENDRKEKRSNIADLIQRSSAFSTCRDTEEAREIKKILGAQKYIVVVVENGSGYGHQKAAATGMQRLVELGFQGVFLVRVAGGSESIRNRLDFLLQSSPEIKFHHTKRKHDEKLNLGFCFASDGPRFDSHKKYNVNHFISLAPTDWTGTQEKIFSDQIKWSSELVNTIESGILEAESCAQALPPPESICNLITGRELGYYKIISIYGLRDWPTTPQAKISTLPQVIGLAPDQELDILIKSLLTRDVSNAPVVIPIIADTMIDVREVSNRVKIVQNIDNFDAKSLENGEIVIVMCGKLPPHSFNAIVRNSDLFIAEGSNSISLAKREGIPFLVGGRQYPRRDGLKDNSAYAAASKSLTYALPENFTFFDRRSMNEMNSKSSRDAEMFSLQLRVKAQETAKKFSLAQRTKNLSHFIGNCLDGHLHSDYQACQSDFLSRSDKVFASLASVCAAQERN